MTNVIPYFPFTLSGSTPADSGPVNANFENIRQAVNVGGYMTLNSTAISIAIATAAASTAAISGAIVSGSSQIIVAATTQVTNTINTSAFNAFLVAVPRMFIPCAADVNAGVIRLTPATGFYAPSLVDGITFTFTNPVAMSSTGSLPVSVTTIGGNVSIANVNCVIAAGTRLDLAYDGGSATFLIVGMSQALNFLVSSTSGAGASSLGALQLITSGALSMPLSSGQYVPALSIPAMTLISLTSAGSYTGHIPRANYKVTMVGKGSTGRGNQSSQATIFTDSNGVYSTSIDFNTATFPLPNGAANAYFFEDLQVNAATTLASSTPQTPYFGNLLSANIGVLNGFGSSFDRNTYRIGQSVVFYRTDGALNSSYAVTIPSADATFGAGAVFIEYSS